MLRLTRNTYQHGWIETRPSKEQDLVFVYRWRERKPDGGYTKRSEVDWSRLNAQNRSQCVAGHRASQA